MRLGLRRLAFACLMAGSAIIVLVPGGSAGNRQGTATFNAFPGPGSVTYGKNIAYSATLDNGGNSVFTQVRFHQSRPVARFEGETVAAADPVAASCDWVIDTRGDTDPTNDELTCAFDQLRPEDDPLRITIVWPAPTLVSPTGCPSCLTTKGSWTIKENKATNGNESFPPNGAITVSAELLGGEGTAETERAGSYELTGCTGNTPSLSTNPDVDLSNPVATSFCLPAFQTSGADLGLATTIVEGPAQPGDPGVTGLRSDVCIADLGEDCVGVDVPYPFTSADPVTLVFRIADDVLDNGDQITEVFHDGDPDPLPSCTVDATIPSGEDDCVVSIQRSGGPVKIWTVVVLSEENGFYNW